MLASEREGMGAASFRTLKNRLYKTLESVPLRYSALAPGVWTGYDPIGFSVHLCSRSMIVTSLWFLLRLGSDSYLLCALYIIG